jgi:serine acetyltransferase
MGGAEELSSPEPAPSENSIGHAETWGQLRHFWHVEIVGTERTFSWRRLISKCRRDTKFAFLFWFRVAQLCYRSRNWFLKRWGTSLRARLKRNHAMDINIRAEIGEGLYIPHPVGVVVAARARIGRNCTIFQNVTIGSRQSGKGFIRVGDNVSIGAHACIIGNNIIIGDDVAIGATSFVNQGIPAGTTFTNVRERRVRTRSDESFPMLQKNIRSKPGRPWTMSLLDHLSVLWAPKANDLPRIHGRVFVLGSAPGAQPPPAGRQWTFATVNGSQAILQGWGHLPDMTLFGRTFIAGSPANAETRRVIRGQGTKTLICVGARREYRYYNKAIHAIGYKPERVALMTSDYRKEMIRRWIELDVREIGRLSNGVVLALLSLDLGAEEVVMSGLSLSTHGHAYSDKNYSRGHIDADRLALNEIARRGLPVRALDPTFAEESSLPLYAS